MVKPIFNKDSISTYIGLLNLVFPIYFLLQEHYVKMFLGYFLLILLVFLYLQAFRQPQLSKYYIFGELLITILFSSLFNSMYLYLAFIFIYQVAIQSTKFIYIFSFAFSVSAMIILYFSEAFTQLNSFLLHLPPLFGGVFLPFFLRAAFQYKKLSEELERKNKELILIEENKRRLLADLSHDLKTPITTIQGYSKLLYDDLVDDPKQMKKYLKYIYEKSVRVSLLIDDLFMYSKLDSPDIIVNKKITDINEFLREVIAEYYEQFEGNQMELVLSIPTKRILLPFDNKLFYRVFSNLFENAIKYNPPKTSISIQVIERKDLIRIEVADNGVEINSELASTLFNPFVRGDKSRQTEGGTGLGLSISKKIINLHNGTIHLENTKGRWSKVFVIELPLLLEK